MGIQTRPHGTGMKSVDGIDMKVKSTRPYPIKLFSASIEATLKFQPMREPKTGPDLIELFWSSVTLLQNFKPMNDEKIGHVTILLLSDWLKILE